MRESFQFCTSFINNMQFYPVLLGVVSVLDGVHQRIMATANSY